MKRTIGEGEDGGRGEDVVDCDTGERILGQTVMRRSVPRICL